MEPFLREGAPVEVILEQIEGRKIDLVALRSHGHGAVYDLLVGSVCESTLRRITCPALVVPDAKRGAKAP